MNRIVTFLTLCVVAIAATAQTTDIEVSYVAHKPNFKNGKVDSTNRYVLLANATGSRFFSPVTEYIDSLNSTPDGKAKLKEMSRAAFSSGKMDDIPTPDGTIYVEKSFVEGRLKHYDTAGLEKYVYEEQIGEWNWNTGDSTKEVLGYECIVAYADYHGRKWTVWFAPEIPVNNGPWKLDGLPGLILEASTDDGQYSFIATGVQQTAKPIGTVCLADEYEKTTRKKFLKSKRAFIDNPLGKINAQMGGDINVSSDGGEPWFAPASIVDFIETDY